MREGDPVALGLPHREPFIFVDEVRERVAGEGAWSGALAGAGVLLATAAGADLRRIRGMETAMEKPPRRNCAERDTTPAGVMSVVRFSGLL